MDGQQLIYHFHWLNNNATIVQIENGGCYSKSVPRIPNTHTWIYDISFNGKGFKAAFALLSIEKCMYVPSISVEMKERFEMLCDVSTNAFFYTAIHTAAPSHLHLLALHPFRSISFFTLNHFARFFSTSLFHHKCVWYENYIGEMMLPLYK